MMECVAILAAEPVTSGALTKAPLGSLSWPVSCCNWLLPGTLGVGVKTGYAERESFS